MAHLFELTKSRYRKKGWIEVQGLIGLLGFDDELNWRGTLIDFRSDRRGTVRTKVFVFIALRQDQEQFLSDWHCGLASRTVEGGRFKFLKASLLHSIIIKLPKRQFHCDLITVFPRNYSDNGGKMTGGRASAVFGETLCLPTGRQGGTFASLTAEMKHLGSDLAASQVRLSIPLKTRHAGVRKRPH